MLEAVVTEETSDGAGDRAREEGEFLRGLLEAVAAECKFLRGPCAYFPVVGNLKKHGPG